MPRANRCFCRPVLTQQAQAGGSRQQSVNRIQIAQLACPEFTEQSTASSRSNAKALVKTIQFARDRRRYLHWVVEARRRYRLSVLDYMVTSNHIHLLVKDTRATVIAESMQLMVAARHRNATVSRSRIETKKTTFRRRKRRKSTRTCSNLHKTKRSRVKTGQFGRDESNACVLALLRYEMITAH